MQLRVGGTGDALEVRALVEEVLEPQRLELRPQRRGGEMSLEARHREDDSALSERPDDVVESFEVERRVELVEVP